MSAGATNTSQAEVLPKRVSAVHSDARQLVDALTQVKRTRQVLLLALVAFVCVSCYAFYQLFDRFRQKDQLDKLASKAQERFEKNRDNYMREVQGLVEHAQPVITNAFVDQAKKDLPAFVQATQSERDKLVEDLQEKLNARLKAHHEQLLAKHQKILREEFPAVEDEKLHAAMMANLQVAVDSLVKKYYVEELKSELLALYGLWDEFPAVPAPTTGEPPLADQLYVSLLELLKFRLTETSPAIAAATPSGAPPVAQPVAAPSGAAPADSK
jgi:hypothetical protein